MLRHRNIGRVCCVVLAFTLLLTAACMGAESMGLVNSAHAMGYEDRLFDTEKVHTLDIVMDDWNGFIDTCEDEEYTDCTVIIDGEKFSNVAIRAKGNTSLSSVSKFGNDRYSFKIEFDHYDGGMTYHGLDKLSLNNLIQDATFMKDYLVYSMMNKMGVAAPLCSFVYITVNGEDWGLYLAVEGVEESFIERNYGADSGNMYKPDSMSFGGGRGNGQDFDMDEFGGEAGWNFETENTVPGMPFGMGGMGNQPGGMPGQMNGMSDSMGEVPDDLNGFAGNNRGEKGGGFAARGSSDVMLQYVDDDPASYANIFDNAVTDVTEADQKRLIAALKGLAEGDTTVVDTDAVIRYLVVHDFVRNDDSYTGSMIHNYYLYEEDGVLSMVPWDYNLAFGGFSGGSASDQINSPIDSPVSSGDLSSRPMVAWIFDSDEYIARYHEVYAQLISDVIDNGWLDGEIARVSGLIAPYVENDPTAFFTYEEFETGVAALRNFCTLRGESISGQLSGQIASTSEGQLDDNSSLINADGLNLSDMGNSNWGRAVSGSGFEGIGIPEGMNIPEEIVSLTEEAASEATEPDSQAVDTQPEESGRSSERHSTDNVAVEEGSGSIVLMVSCVGVLIIGIIIAAAVKSKNI